MHEYLRTAPFDLYELHLFHLVAKHKNFTRAANTIGLTQSAMTRQIKGMETCLGLPLLERTTRSVRLTPAGEFLLRESSRLLGDVEQSLRRLQEEFGNARKEVRVGVSRTIGLAYLPGFFHANLRRQPKVSCRVSYQSSAGIISALEANELDVGVFSSPARLPNTLRITHKFEDAFTIVAPSGVVEAFASLPASRRVRYGWLQQQQWLLIEDGTETGRQLRNWMNKKGLKIDPVMQLDSFDLIINLVALNMGLSFVPIRALALYGQKRSLARLPLPERFARELVVVVRKHRQMPDHLHCFVENILF